MTVMPTQHPSGYYPGQPGQVVSAMMFVGKSIIQDIV